MAEMISSKQKPSQTWVSIKMWMGVALMLLGGAVVDQANGYCFEIGQNPSWTGPPHVQQVRGEVKLLRFHDIR